MALYVESHGFIAACFEVRHVFGCKTETETGKESEAVYIALVQYITSVPGSFLLSFSVCLCGWAGLRVFIHIWNREGSRSTEKARLMWPCLTPRRHHGARKRWNLLSFQRPVRTCSLKSVEKYRLLCFVCCRHSHRWPPECSNHDAIRTTLIGSTADLKVYRNVRKM